MIPRNLPNQPQWWTSAALVQLRKQLNAKYPGRDHASDGSVGDPAHAARASDHNPSATSTPPWVVRAIDIDEDFTQADDDRANQLVSQLIRLDDPRLTFIIFERLKYVRIRHWLAEVYRGANAHLHHIHVSASALGDHDGRLFDLPLLRLEEP